MKRESHAKLHAAEKLYADLDALWRRLHSLGPRFASDAATVAASRDRVGAHLGSGWWPPIWWRYGSIDEEPRSLSHHFHRIEAEGFFFPEDAAAIGEEILKTLESISSAYETARRKRGPTIHSTRTR